MKLLLIRHGATPGNLEKRYVGRTDESLTQESLETLGKEAKKIRKLAGKPAAIITSPMKRCLETAETLVPEHDYPQVPRVRVEDLSECDFGKFEYKNYLELSGDMEYQHFIDTMGAEGFPGGESTETFKARTVKAFREILARFFWETEDPDKTLVFVVHGGTIMAVMEALAKERKSYYDWQVGNGEGIFGEIETPDGRIGQVRFLRNNPIS